MERISARQVQSSERFYRIPKIFVESPLYKPMSTDAKFTYAILKDRFELSLRNNWIDKNGDVYLIYTITELQEILGYGNKKVIKLKKELQEYGLLEEVRQGLNKPNLLYLGNIEYQALPTEEIHSKPSETAEMSKRHVKRCRNNTLMILRITRLNYLTILIDTRASHLYLIYQSLKHLKWDNMVFFLLN